MKQRERSVIERRWLMVHSGTTYVIHAATEQEAWIRSALFLFGRGAEGKITSLNADGVWNAARCDIEEEETP